MDGTREGRVEVQRTNKGKRREDVIANIGMREHSVTSC